MVPLNATVDRELEVWLDAGLVKKCERCEKRIHLRQMRNGEWVALGRYSPIRVHEDNDGRLFAGVLASDRHHCPPAAE